MGGSVVVVLEASKTVGLKVLGRDRSRSRHTLGSAIQGSPPCINSTVILHLVLILANSSFTYLRTHSVTLGVDMSGTSRIENFPANAVVGLKVSHQFEEPLEEPLGGQLTVNCSRNDGLASTTVCSIGPNQPPVQPH